MPSAVTLSLLDNQLLDLALKSTMNNENADYFDKSTIFSKLVINESNSSDI